MAAADNNANDNSGSPALSLGSADLYALLVSAMISGLGAVLGTLGQLTPEYFAWLGPLAPLLTSVCLVAVATIREWIAAGDFSQVSWRKLLTSVGLAVGGAAAAWLQSLLAGGVPGPTSVATWAFLINLFRKFTFDTRTS